MRKQDSNRGILKQLLRGTVTPQEAKQALEQEQVFPVGICWGDGTYSLGPEHKHITEAEYLELTKGKEVSLLRFV